ncbi:MAG: regulatory protein RecX [Pseudomonadota bacterium]
MNTSSMRLSAMNILALREHSIKELKSKLEKKFVVQLAEDNSQLDQVISQLLEDNLLSDERFAEVFVRSRMKKGFGPVKVRYELSIRGVANDIIKDSLNISEQKWLDSMHKAWNKKFLKSSAENKLDQAKQSRYLYQRGFSYDQIKAFLYSK